jgi:hypothetical protein
MAIESACGGAGVSACGGAGAANGDGAVSGSGASRGVQVNANASDGRTEGSANANANEGDDVVGNDWAEESVRRLVYRVDRRRI